MLGLYRLLQNLDLQLQLLNKIPVIDYNYYLNLSNQLLLNYFRTGHDNVFFKILGPLPNLEMVKQGTSNLVHKF